MAIIKAYCKGETYDVLVDPWLKQAIEERGWKVSLNNKGYPQIANGKQKTQNTSISRTVLGFPPEGFVANYINRNKLDCRLENLRFVSRSISIRHTKSPILGWIDLAKSWIKTRPHQYHLKNSYETISPGIYRRGKWGFGVRVVSGGKDRYLGTYPLYEQAYQIWVEKQIEMGRYV